MYMKFRRAISAVLVVGAVTVGASFAWRSSAQGVINLTTCQTINSSGSYRLANDVSGSGWCFSIRTGNVTFDGNGKTITSSTGSALEVADYTNEETGYADVSISNFTSTGEVRSFGNNINHVTFQNLHVYGITDFGSDDVTIDNNILASGGVQVNNADRPWVPLRPIITNNTITGEVGHTNKILLEIAGPSHPCPRVDGLVTGNTVNNYRNDFPQPEATAVIRIRCATHNTVRNNFFRSFGTTMGLYIRDESDDGIYENNVFWTNLYPALWIAAGNNDKTFPSRNLFYNNTFRTDDGYGFYGSAVGTGNVFTYNTFFSNSGLLGYIGGYYGNTYDHNTFYNASGGQVVTFQGDNTEGPPADTYTNNIFSYNGTQVFGYDAWRASRYSGNYNLFYNRGGALAFGTVNGVSNTTLAQWRTATGDDANSINANPLLGDPAAGDFTIATNSPARGAGSSGTDIGAKPFGTEPPPVCVESWSCGAWSACTSGTQTRTCTDAYSCGTTISRPALSRSCPTSPLVVTIDAPTNGATVNSIVHIVAGSPINVFMSSFQFLLDGQNLGTASAEYWHDWDSATATNGSHTLSVVGSSEDGRTGTATPITVTVSNVVPGCTESWSCGAFSACANNTQSRTCTDAYACGTITNRPPLTQSCVSPDSAPPAHVSDLRAS